MKHRLTLLVSGLLFTLPVSGQTMSVNNTAQYLGNGRYSWTVFLKGDLAHVASVQYTLHPTFPEPVVWGKGPNFAYSSVGWGEFNVLARIYYKDKLRKPTTLNHWLRLFTEEKAKSK
jgi:transcription initiation factor IIF auxiliary subunit